MLDFDSNAVFDPPSPPAAARKRRASKRDARADERRILPEIQAFPAWARLQTSPLDGAGAAFAAGASLARLDQILRSGGDALGADESAGADVSSASRNVGTEPVYVGALRQRLALRAGAACAALARLREDEAALRDAAHLAGVDAAPTPGARLHRLWRLFASPRHVRQDAPIEARLLRVAADHLNLPPDIDVDALVALAQETRNASPLVAAARVSVETLRILNDVAPIDAEIFAFWLADLVLAQQLRWDAPLPLLATTIAHPALRTASHRRPRPSDPGWSLSVARAYARAAQEAYAFAGDLSRRSETLLLAAPKLRAKAALRVVDLLLSDDCVSASQAAKAAGLSDRAARRLFDRLMALSAVRELSGRTNFRLYGL